MTVRVLPYGERGLLTEIGEPALVPGLLDLVRAVDGVVEAVPGACTVLAVVAAGVDVAAIAATLRDLRPSATSIDRGATVEIDVHYDGADLDAVADAAGLDRDSVVAAHSVVTYVVRFCGFSPGFGYLDGLDERLRLPRRADPRSTVPAGSVGIAGEFTGVYPRASPGGWHLLGRTDAVLWDARRDPPALLSPGTAVRFVPA